MIIGKVSKGHIIIGSILITIALAIAIILIVTQFGAIGSLAALGFGVFFFGTWGGVEIGRFVEARFRDMQGDSL